jgi:hypothetical protein
VIQNSRTGLKPNANDIVFLQQNSPEIGKYVADYYYFFFFTEIVLSSLLTDSIYDNSSFCISLGAVLSLIIFELEMKK